MAEKTEEQKKADYAARAAKSKATRERKAAEKAETERLASYLPTRTEPQTATVTLTEPEAVTATNTEADIIDLSVSTDFEPDLMVKPGDDIFLRYRSGPSIKIGKMRLSCMTQEAVVPEDISGDDLLKLDGFVRDGTIRVGKISKETPIQPETSSSGDEYVKDWYVDQLKESYEKLRNAVVGLTKAGRFISGWHPKDLLIAMNKAETLGDNRPPIVKFITEGIRTLRTISFASEDFDPAKHAVAVKHWDVRRFYKPKG